MVRDPVAPTLLLHGWLLKRRSPYQIASRAGDIEMVATSLDAGLGIGHAMVALRAE